MKRSIWLGYAIAPFSGPFLYCVIALFIPEITNTKEFGAETWFGSLLLFSLFSYVACFLYGAPLFHILKKYNILTLFWVIFPSTVFYALIFNISLFYILGGEITGNALTAIGFTLSLGLGLGIVISLSFSAIVGITRK